jgi:hypothetical protein
MLAESFVSDDKDFILTVPEVSAEKVLGGRI